MIFSFPEQSKENIERKENIFRSKRPNSKRECELEVSNTKMPLCFFPLEERTPFDFSSAKTNPMPTTGVPCVSTTQTVSFNLSLKHFFKTNAPADNKMEYKFIKPIKRFPDVKWKRVIDY